MTKPTHEVRVALGEVRAQTQDGKPTMLTGYASVFYRAGDGATQFNLWPGCVERISPGAFDRALKDADDTRALFNHNPELLLGRTKSGTCRLSVDERGLKYEVDLADTTVARDVAQHIQRGDLSGSSFSFAVEDEEWTTERTAEGVEVEVRTIKSVGLFDVGPVTFPAYEGTDTAARQARSAWSQAHPPAKKDAWESRAKLRAACIAAHLPA